MRETAARQQFVCVSCGSENIQRLTAIVTAGTWQNQSVTVGAVIGDVEALGGAVTQQSGASGIAALLAPPAQPSTRNLLTIVLNLMGIPILLVAVLFGVAAFSADGPRRGDLFAIAIPALVFSVGCLLIGNWLYRRNVARMEAEGGALFLWRRAMEVWERVFYCARCHTTCDLETGRAAPAQNMHSLLEWD